MLTVCVVDVPSLLFDVLLSSTTHSQSTATLPLLSDCVRLLRALARDNEVIQRRIFDGFEVLLDVNVIRSDVALLLRDVRRRSFVRSFVCVLLEEDGDGSISFNNCLQLCSNDRIEVAPSGKYEQ